MSQSGHVGSLVSRPGENRNEWDIEMNCLAADEAARDKSPVSAESAQGMQAMPSPSNSNDATQTGLGSIRSTDENYEDILGYRNENWDPVGTDEAQVSSDQPGQIVEMNTDDTTQVEGSDGEHGTNIPAIGPEFRPPSLSAEEVAVSGLSSNDDRLSTFAQHAAWWKPISLRPASLVLFSLMSVAVNASLIYLFVRSEKHHGISAVSHISPLTRRLVPAAGTEASTYYRGKYVIFDLIWLEAFLIDQPI